MSKNGTACRSILGVTRSPLCRALQKAFGAFRNLFQFIFRACANGYAAFVYTSTPSDTATAVTQARADQVALAGAEARADKLCKGEGNFYLLADEHGNLIVSEDDKVIISN